MSYRSCSDTSRNSGSPKKSEPEFLPVGKLGKPFGLRGEMRIEVYLDDLEVFSPGNDLFIGESRNCLGVISFRASGKNFLIRLESIDTPEKARLLTNQTIYLPTKNLPTLGDGKYYYFQLIGMHVEDDEGNNVGTVAEIIETSANDVYVVLEEITQKEILIPAIPSVILKIDIESNLIVVKLQEWIDDGS